VTLLGDLVVLCHPRKPAKVTVVLMNGGTSRSSSTAETGSANQVVILPSVRTPDRFSNAVEAWLISACRRRSSLSSPSANRACQSGSISRNVRCRLLRHFRLPL
jgi:hypothetical protein